MAWAESYHCDVCGKEKNEESVDWWLVWVERFTPNGSEVVQPLMKITPWDAFLSHAAEMRHICGARCAQTLLNRWMLNEDEQG
jgi:thiamine monophosphate synthase